MYDRTVKGTMRVRNFLLNTFYHPMLFFFLLPLFYMALGVIFSLQYNAFNYLSLIIFYVFILSNQMLENMLLRIPTNNFQLSKKFVLVLEFLTLLALMYFGWQHSWMASLVLFCFTLIIQLQFLFSYYSLEYVSIFIANFFKLILLNSFAFYMGTNFLYSRFIPYYFGLFLPFFLYEASRISTPIKNKLLIPLIAGSYLVSIVLLWQYFTWFSLLILLSLPFAWLLITEYSRKTAATYTVIFSILYTCLTTYAFF